MNFGQRQRDPTKHFVGIAAVILFHGFVIYALMTGLAKKVIEVVRAPIETKVIEEVKKPPPPPEVVLPPPPKLPVAKGISFTGVDPRVQPALKPLELAPCFQKVASAASYTVRLKRDGQALDAKCAPSGTVCTCVEQVVQEWPVPELKDGQGLSFTIVANP